MLASFPGRPTFAGYYSLEHMHTSVWTGRRWHSEAGPFILRCLLILGMTAAQAADRPQTLRAGTGLRQQDIRLEHLTQKATCTKAFLGQTPLFKGEWIPHKVSCDALEMLITIPVPRKLSLLRHAENS